MGEHRTCRKTSDVNNDYIRMLLLREIAIGELFTWGYVYDIVRKFGRTNRNSTSRVLSTLLEYKYIVKVSDGLYRKIQDYHTKDIEFLWIEGNPELMIKKTKIDGVVVSLELDDSL